jgi:hypothetical protein
MKLKSRMLWSYSPILGLLFSFLSIFCIHVVPPSVLTTTKIIKKKENVNRKFKFTTHTHMMEFYNLFWITWAWMTFPAYFFFFFVFTLTSDYSTCYAHIFVHNYVGFGPPNRTSCSLILCVQPLIRIFLKVVIPV